MNKPNLNKPAFQLFPEKANRVREEMCPTCSNPINKKDFKDALSIKEYGISGMCQECQDSIFG